MISDDTVSLVHVVSHPVRYRILNLLREEGTEMYITEIAERLEINHRLASFHLGALLQYELVEGDWKVSKTPRSKGKAVKYYKMTGRAKRILTQCGL